MTFVDILFKALGVGFAALLVLQIPLELRRKPAVMTRVEFDRRSCVSVQTLRTAFRHDVEPAINETADTETTQRIAS